jgi:hypothetical protein
VTAPIDPDRRAALSGALLRTLAGDPPGAEVVPFGAGAGLHTPDATWVLIERAGAGIGAALAWAGERAPGPLHVVVTGPAAERAGVLARQATNFLPAPTVWRARGRDLEAVEPQPPAAPAEPAPAALGSMEALREADLDVVVEHGVVRGEIEGLEVAVVAVDEDGTARIEVGVGRNDREAFALLHGDLAPASALRRVADTVRQHRRAGAAPHPLNRMAPERWLRARLLHDPDRLPGWSLGAIAGPEQRRTVDERGPAFAYGLDADAAPVVLACSVGIDLELVPAAADARAAVEPHARLVLAVPARDAHPVTRALAAMLERPAELLPIDGGGGG